VESVIRNKQEIFSAKLEQVIAEFCNTQNDDTNYNVLTALVEGVMNEVEVVAAAGFDNMLDPNELKEGMELSGLHFLRYNLEDKSFFVMYSSEAKTQELTCPSMLRCSLYQFLVNAKHEEGLTGVIINPGKENYVMTQDMVKILLDYIYEICKK